jgi:predicted  nucleic acid-binding Zn-ribbon protein
MLHDRPEIIPIVIAVVCAFSAAYLALMGRIQTALAREKHAVVAMKDATEKLLEANKDIVALRRQIAQLMAENEELSGRLLLAEKPIDEDWEATQSLLESAAKKLDASIPASAPVAKAVPKESKELKDLAAMMDPDAPTEFGKLIFRRGPIELDPSDFEGDRPEEE